MYATYEVLSNKIVLDYTSSKGEWLGGEAVHINPNFRGDLQQVAYQHASVRAHIHGVRLEALRLA